MEPSSDTFSSRFQSHILGRSTTLGLYLHCPRKRALTNLEQSKEILEKVEEKAEENPCWEETLQQILKHICSQKMATFSAKQVSGQVMTS